MYVILMGKVEKKNSVQIFAPTEGLFREICKIKNGMTEIMDWA